MEAPVSESYCYSTDTEIFRGEAATREEAVLLCIEEEEPEEGATIETALSVPIHPTSFMPDADEIIDSMTNQANDEVGEVSEDWLANVTADRKIDLQDKIHTVILKWLEEGDDIPKFWRCSQIQQHVVTAELIAQA
jgi:hypothetical protein